MSIGNASLNLGTCARNATESARPDLWPDHAWVPALGIQGGRLVDVAGGVALSVAAGTWGMDRLSLSGGQAAIGPSLGAVGDMTILATFVPTSNLITDGGSVYYQGTTDDEAPPSARRHSDLIDWSLLYTGSIIRGRFSTGTSSYSVDSTTGLVAGRAVAVAMVRESTSLCMYIDGAYDAEAAIDSGASTNVGHFAIGSENADSLHDTGCVFSAVTLARRAFSAAQIRDLSADPLLPFRRRAVRSWFLPTGPTFKPAWARTTHTVQAGVST